MPFTNPIEDRICYANSALLILIHAPFFRTYISTYKIRENTTASTPLHLEIIEILDSLGNPFNKKFLNANSVIEEVNKWSIAEAEKFESQAVIFTTGDDCDCEEFFKVLLNALDEEKKKLKCKIYTTNDLLTSATSTLTTVVCCTAEGCGNENKNIEYSSTIQLAPTKQKSGDTFANTQEKKEFTSIFTFEDMITEFMTPPGILPDYKCDKCKAANTTNKSHYFSKLAPILIICIPGFDNDNINVHDVYREKYILEEGSLKKNYVPWSFVCRTEPSEGVFHFIVVSKYFGIDGVPVQQWIMFDDDETTKVVEKEMSDLVTGAVMMIIIEEGELKDGVKKVGEQSPSVTSISSSPLFDQVQSPSTSIISVGSSSATPKHRDDSFGLKTNFFDYFLKDFKYDLPQAPDASLDVPLLWFLTCNHSSLLWDLCLTLTTYGKTPTRNFKVHLCHNCGHDLVDPRIMRGEDLLRARFKGDADRASIKKCLISSTTLLAYGVDSRGVTVVISIVNFVIDNSGLYINWLATEEANYNTVRWKNGDNKPFSGRGLATIMLQILWDIARMLPYDVMPIPRFYLQVNPEEMANSYYIHRGFEEIDGNALPSSMQELANKSVIGRSLHWIDNVTEGEVNIRMTLLACLSTMTSTKGTGPAALGYDSMLFASPLKKGSRVRNRKNANPKLNALYKEKLITQSRIKGRIAKKKYESYILDNNIDTFDKKLAEGKTNYLASDQYIFRFPPTRTRTNNLIEASSTNTDRLDFFDPDELRVSGGRACFSHLRKIQVGVGNLVDMLPGNWLSTGPIDCLITYMLRNQKNTGSILFCTSLALKGFLSECDKGEINPAVYDILRSSMCISEKNKQKKKEMKKMFDYDYWILPINANMMHWKLVIICHPKALFDDTITREPFFLCFDSMKPTAWVSYMSKTATTQFGRFLVYCWNKQFPNTKTTKMAHFGTSMKHVAKHLVDCYKQDNGCDCGLYVVVHAREFILSIARGNTLLTGDMIKVRDTNFYSHTSISHISEYNSEVRLLELREASLSIFNYIYSNFPDQSNPAKAKNKKRVKKEQVLDIIKIIETGFLTVAETMKICDSVHSEDEKTQPPRNLHADLAVETLNSTTTKNAKSAVSADEKTEEEKSTGMNDATSAVNKKVSLGNRANKHVEKVKQKKQNKIKQDVAKKKNVKKNKQKDGKIAKEQKERKFKKDGKTASEIPTLSDEAESKDKHKSGEDQSATTEAAKLKDTRQDEMKDAFKVLQTVLDVVEPQGKLHSENQQLPNHEKGPNKDTGNEAITTGQSSTTLDANLENPKQNKQHSAEQEPPVTEKGVNNVTEKKQNKIKQDVARKKNVKKNKQKDGKIAQEQKKRKFKKDGKTASEIPTLSDEAESKDKQISGEDQSATTEAAKLKDAFKVLQTVLDVVAPQDKLHRENQQLPSHEKGPNKDKTDNEAIATGQVTQDKADNEAITTGQEKSTSEDALPAGEEEPDITNEKDKDKQTEILTQYLMELELREKQGIEDIEAKLLKTKTVLEPASPADVHNKTQDKNELEPLLIQYSPKVTQAPNKKITSDKEKKNKSKTKPKNNNPKVTQSPNKTSDDESESTETVATVESVECTPVESKRQKIRRLARKEIEAKRVDCDPTNNLEPVGDTEYAFTEFYRSSKRKFGELSTRTINDAFVNKGSNAGRFKLIGDGKNMELDKCQKDELREQIDKLNKQQDKVLSEIEKMKQLNIKDRIIKTYISSKIKKANELQSRIKCLEMKMHPENMIGIRHVGQKKILATNEFIKEQFWGITASGEEVLLDNKYLREEFHLEFIMNLQRQTYEGQDGGDEYDVNMNVDGRQICNLRYDRYSKIGIRLAKPKWIATCINDTKEYVVTQKWVKENFENTYLEEVKRIKNQYLPIPPGAAKLDINEDVIVINPSFPSVSYQQGDKRFCLGYSWANALMYYFGNGHCALTNQIASNANKIATSPFFAQKTIQLTECLYKNHMVVVLCDKIHEHYGHFDLLSMESEYPSLFVLIGDDQSVTHAVATVGPWIFDSNLPNAQKLNQEILDWCVSSPEKKQRCIDIYWGIRLIPKPPNLSFLKQGTNQYCAHESLANILDLLGEHCAAVELVALTPKHVENRDWFVGMNDFFQINQFMKFTYEKRKLNSKGYCFQPTTDIVLMTFTNCNNDERSVAIFGSWLFDATKDKPILVDSNYMKHVKIKRLFKLTVLKNMKNMHRACYDDKLLHLFRTYPVLSYGIN